ncbi:uncharacterized protein LOC124362522 isoform X2 [Homalodisca vitripennis]|uniref:uncharacterized protein LOC124362522 isoform X2 n=1 Tax=Homalodisca vitripennis TaxID=197043 RepID=UPI001EEA53E6|nr:uncharacterized protein LOC124362522 isoform X2 [Homalodisca vitripennis]
MALNEEEIYEEILYCSSPTLGSELNDILIDALVEDGVNKTEEIGSKSQHDETKPLDDAPDAKAFNDVASFDEGGENILIDEMLTSNIEMNLDNMPIVIMPEGVDAADFLSEVIDVNIEKNYETDSLEHNKMCFFSGVIEPEDESEVFDVEANHTRNEITDQQDDLVNEFNAENIFESSSDTDNVPSDLEYEPEARIESRQQNNPENVPSDLEDEPELITEIRQQNT